MAIWEFLLKNILKNIYPSNTIQKIFTSIILSQPTLRREGKVKSKNVSSHEENAWSRHQRLFKENIRKTKKRSANFENKVSGVVCA